MKLQKCIEIAEACGLQTIGDALLNVDMHALSIFDYGKLSDELREMYGEYNDLYNRGLAAKDTLLQDVKVLINE